MFYQGIILVAEVDSLSFLEKYLPLLQETSITDSFLEQAFNTHMSQYETTKSEFKVPISEPKSKDNLTSLISKTKMNSPSTPSPMKSQRLMQRRKQVSTSFFKYQLLVPVCHYLPSWVLVGSNHLKKWHSK